VPPVEDTPTASGSIGLQLRAGAEYSKSSADGQGLRVMIRSITRVSVLSGFSQ